MQRFGAWALQDSRSNPGKKYYFNTVTSKSLWYDETLPAGWAWGKASEAAPRFYVNLWTGDNQEARPSVAAEPPPTSSTLTAPSQSSSGRDGGDGSQPPPARRARIDNDASSSTGVHSHVVDAANGASTAATSSANSASTTGRPAAAGAGSGSSDRDLELPPAVELPGKAIPGRKVPTFPSTDVLTEQCKFGFCEAKPGLAKKIDGSFFLPSHQLVVSQLLRCARQQYLSTRDTMRARLIARGTDPAEADEEASRMAFTVVDLGAGTGAVTQYVVDHAPEAEVQAMDLWHLGARYYAEQLRLYGHDGKAAAFEKGFCNSGNASSGRDAPVDPFTQFCANFWGHERVFPCLFPAAGGIATLQYQEIVPWLLWIDADLQYHHLKTCLDFCWKFGWADPAGELVSTRRRPGPVLIGGGSWDLSEGVRRAVLDFASEHGLSLHVEQGQAWTFARDAITETNNDPGNPLHTVIPTSDPKVIEALRIREVETQRAAAKTVWMGAVMGVIEEHGSTPAQLLAAVGTHGRKQAGDTAATDGSALASTATAAPASSAAPAASGPPPLAPALVPNPEPVEPFAGEVWIDSGGDDKRHLTPLMRAAKSGRVDLVKCLIEACGADVNARAEKSSYTALHSAAYDGHTAVVRMLLEHGADASLCNKFGETAAQCAKRHRGVVDLINGWKK